jgi:sporulation protein YlmC with PRC-barrel domain
MKRNSTLAAGALGMTLACGLVIAADPVREPVGPRDPAIRQDGTARPDVKRQDAPEQLMVSRAGDVMSMAVMNPQGQDLGKIKDLVIDLNTGKVRYAAISFGGFLGIGDKLFAVPFRALTLKQNAADNVRYFEIDVDKKRLERAQGFDDGHWPDFADPAWGAENDKLYLESADARR